MLYNQEEFDEILNIFKAESDEIIQKFNDRFMELECSPENKAPIKELFQLAHSLKGGARMIGFKSIQDISHKLEDILAYWKNDSVSIDAGFFNVIYKVCDFLSVLVEKSVRMKADCKDENTEIFLNQLNSFIAANVQQKEPEAEKNAKVQNPVLDADEEYIAKKAADINAVILELIFIAEKDNEQNLQPDAAEVLKEKLEQLAEIFKNVKYTEAKEKISALMKIPADNTAENAQALKTGIAELKDIIYNIYKNLNITPAEKIHKTDNTPHEAKKEAHSAGVNTIEDEKFSFVLSNMQKIKTDKNSCNEIISALKALLEIITDSRMCVIIEKIINIIDKYARSGKNIDNSCYMVLLQGLFLAKRLSLKDKNDYDGTYTSILQRLMAAEDMLNTASLISKGAQEKESFDILKNDGGTLTAGGASLELKALNLQEIKTLRVDTAKLDNLISQAGELLINGIKTSEHIIELSKINNKLIKWNSESKKILNYLKYLEKKGFFSSYADDSTSIFYKRAQHFFSENAELINEINKDFVNLYNIVSEDGSRLHQTAAEIESIAKGIRVLPLAALFHSFPRMVRDIAQENNKKIDFIISGSDTSVDKKIIEEIKMPLIHILRNSISHGIELPEERLKNGKNETGIVKLSSRQEENNVIITIEDDGYGVNIEKVKEKALEKGLLTAEEIEHADAKQLMKLLFLPGFSTEESVNEISGRGIGLDIVKTKIADLNGEINIDSVLNKGCRVSIRLPLSMSTIKTFILLVNGQKYAVPVNSIKSAAKISKDRIFDNSGIKSIIFENHSIPVYSLSNLLGEPEAPDENGNITVIAAESGGRQAAFIVDKLLGAQEVFQKKLALPIVRIKNISGFTVLPAGEICLIINPFELVRNAGRTA